LYGVDANGNVYAVQPQPPQANHGAFSSCAQIVDFGNDLMATGAVLVFAGQEEARPRVAGVGGIFYLYGRYGCN